MLQRVLIQHIDIVFLDSVPGYCYESFTLIGETCTQRGGITKDSKRVKIEFRGDTWCVPDETIAETVIG